MSRRAIREYFMAIYHRYLRASPAIKHLILNELCANIGYNRKYAIRKLNGPPPERLWPCAGATGLAPTSLRSSPSWRPYGRRPDIPAHSD